MRSILEGYFEGFLNIRGEIRVGFSHEVVKTSRHKLGRIFNNSENGRFG